GRMALVEPVASRAREHRGDLGRVARAGGVRVAVLREPSGDGGGIEGVAPVGRSRDAVWRRALAGTYCAAARVRVHVACARPPTQDSRKETQIKYTRPLFHFWTYDAAGRELTRTDALNKTASTSYDAAGQPI